MSNCFGLGRNTEGNDNRVLTCVPSLFNMRALTLSACPLSFISLAQERGSHTLNTRSVDPLTMTVPEGFMARLYMESRLPFRLDVVTVLLLAVRAVNVLTSHKNMALSRPAEATCK